MNSVTENNRYRNSKSQSTGKLPIFTPNLVVKSHEFLRGYTLSNKNDKPLIKESSIDTQEK